MDQVLQGSPGVQCYLDDIIVTCRTREEHLKALDKILGRLEEYGLKANREKCNFLQNSVEYLGHVITAEELHQSLKKVQAMAHLPSPQNVGQLRAFVGMVQHYAHGIDFFRKTNTGSVVKSRSVRSEPCKRCCFRIESLLISTRTSPWLWHATVRRKACMPSYHIGCRTEVKDR